MGTYTYVDHQDIEITNPAGLKLYVLKCRNGELYEGKLKNDVVCWIKQEFQEEPKLEMQDDFLAEEMDIDSWKIIGYWYESFVTMLNDLSAFLKGYIEMTCENQDERAYIHFEGKTRIQWGRMQWNEITPEASHKEAEIVKRARLLNDV